jgi:hypothetical protein
MKKLHEIKQEMRDILDYVKNYTNSLPATVNLAGAMQALKWVLDEGESPIAKMRKADLKVAEEARKEKEKE